MTGSLVDPRCLTANPIAIDQEHPSIQACLLRLTLKCRGRRSPGIIRRVACTHQPRPARHQLGVGAQSCSGPYVDVAEPAPTLVGHVLLFGVAERSDLVAPNVYCRAGGRVCREKKEKPCRDWCDTPCAATRSENRTLAHQNPTQEAGQAEFKPNALLPREDSNLQPFG